MADIIRINENSWRIDEGFVRYYLLEGEDFALMVDSGASSPDARQTAEGITKLPVKLINTHSDPDHISGNEGFESFWMHPADEPYYRERGGKREVVPVKDGDVIDLGGRPLEVVCVPGHTPGSIALIDINARVLISGDSVQSSNIFMFGPRRNIRDFVKSMEKLQAMKCRFDEVWGGHGDFPSKPDLIDKLIGGADSIIDGTAQGVETERMGVKILHYQFPYAGFYCDLE
ncbi:MAG: MBL fold metallo-hydrolase [Firmicutes bacterium]|nr:MBL fold metallo-hydrolase [Bacillota bacterium]